MPPSLYLETKALLSGAESSKVFSRLGNNVGKERELDAPFGLATDGDVEEYLLKGRNISSGRASSVDEKRVCSH